METSSSAGPGVMDALEAGLRSWRENSEPLALEQWFDRELDAFGAPVRLPLREWSTALRALTEAGRNAGGLPDGVDGRVADFVRMLLRFSRPGGMTTTLQGVPDRPRPFWKSIATSFTAGDIGRVIDWWFPGRDVGPVPPPLPAWSATDRVLGVLRADWTARGDILAFDHREGADALFELYGSGVTWLGPGWSRSVEEMEAPPRPSAWVTSSTADVAEWRFGPAGREVTRLALMLRGRRMGLLADFHEGGGESAFSLDVPLGLTYEPLPTTGAGVLRSGKPGKSAQVICLGPGRADMDSEPRRLQLRPESGDRWVPLLVSWDHARHRKPLIWADLTVTEQGLKCPRDVAWAVRVSWGRDETFVFYRSLGPAARRSFLGCSTTARLLVGRFTPEGDVEPLVKLK